MKIDQLIFDKSIYPRNRHLNLDNEIKPDVENIEKIKDVLEMKGKIDHKITYNKKTMHIIDGTHLFQAMRELGWKDVPKEYLNEIDIPIEKEMWQAALMNAAHGKALTRNEIKAIFLLYHDTGERMKYGSIKDFSKDFNIPYNTLRNWIDYQRGTTKPNSQNSENSHEESGEELADLKKENTKLLAENTKIKEQFDELLTWKKSICQDHFQAISKCKNCGK